MIIAVFWQNPLKHLFKFSVNGHSDYSEAGSDIVCAAVSSLVISTVNGLTEIVGMPVNCIVEDNHVLCELLDGSQVQHDQSQILIRTMKLGLTELEKEYPEYLSVNTVSDPLPGGEDNA